MQMWFDIIYIGGSIRNIEIQHCPHIIYQCMCVCVCARERVRAYDFNSIITYVVTLIAITQENIAI